MQIVNRTKTNIEAIEQVGDLKYYSTISDMGSYIGYAGRPWHAKAPQVWKTTKYNVVDVKSNKIVSSQDIMYDANGDISRVVISDNHGFKRLRTYYYDKEDIFKVEDIESLHGKGFSRDKDGKHEWGYWVQDIVMDNKGNEYCYDAKTEKFIDEKNNEFKCENNTTNLANLTCVKDVENLSNRFAENFVEELKNNDLTTN